MSGLSTTLFPIGSWDSCLSSCGALYDANGACVPPAVAAADAATYQKCFCSNAAVAGVAAGSDLCANACGSNQNAKSTMTSWFRSYCSVTAAPTTTNSVATLTGTASSARSTATGSVDDGPGGSWISNHWRWVIAIVIVVVAIIAIWVGACMWRKRYLRSKDRMHEFGRGLPVSNPTVNEAGAAQTPPAGATDTPDSESQAVREKPMPGFVSKWLPNRS